jgi:hypothetical protein
MADGEALKYGWVRGGRQGTEMMMARNYSFNRLGGAFVCASGATGVMKPVTAWTEVAIGWAEVPRAAVPGTVDYYTTNTEVGKDRCLVITDPTAIFGLPAAEDAASLSASLIGRFVCATWTGSGITLIQKVDSVATAVAANQMFFVTGVDVTNKITYVRLNPHHLA